MILDVTCRYLSLIFLYINIQVELLKKLERLSLSNAPLELQVAE